MMTSNTILGAFIAILIFTNPSFSQQARIFSLNQFDESELLKAKGNPDGRSYFQLNEEIFASPELIRGAMLEVQEKNGDIEKLIILEREEYMPGVISIRAYKQGSPESMFIATYNKGTFNGIYYDEPGISVYFGFDNTKAKNYITSKNEWAEDHIACGIDHTKELIPTPHFHNRSTEVKSKASGASLATTAPLVVAEDDSITIDLMIVYTQPAEDWALTSGFGDIDGVIAQSMNLSQTALNNSGIGTKLRLVHAYKTSYNELSDGVSSEDRLSRFTQNTADPVFSSEEGYDGFMDEIHGLRDQFGADVVSWFVRIEDTGGLGWRLSSSGGNADFAFNLNRVQQVASGFTVIHEIGHNMGNAHSRTQSSSEASGGGGLFHYSAGYQNTASNYHTVMAYNDANAQQEAPFFSSPNLTFLGTPTGENSSTVPTDNARSMREIKRTIANYRDTQVDAPVASLLADVINIEMNREENVNIPFQIFNDGESVLVWDIDFSFPPNGFKRAKKAEKTLEMASLEEITKSPYNYSRKSSSKNKSLMAEETLYSTSFESGEGFNAGTHEGISEWRAVSDDEFLISSANPKSGSQHLRIVGDGSGSSKFISAPFFGYQQFGSYEITVNFSVSTTSDTYDFYLIDGKNGEFSAGIIIASNTIFAADLNEESALTFFGTPATVTPNTYHEVKMILDPDNEEVIYKFNGVTIAENGYVGGFSPGELLVLNRSGETGSTIDVDDLEVKKINAPYPWLSVNEPTGYTVEDGFSSRNLAFTTKGVSAGTYKTKMLVRTNDPQKPVIDVPITLTVADVVSNEDTERPLKLSLNQNYPNPFNPATTISYILENSGEIQIEVFNIQGQKVATLFEGKQQAGEHDISFDASSLSSGVYIYRLQTGAQVLTRQMVLIK